MITINTIVHYWNQEAKIRQQIPESPKWKTPILMVCATLFPIHLNQFKSLVSKQKIEKLENELADNLTNLANQNEETEINEQKLSFVQTLWSIKANREKVCSSIILTLKNSLIETIIEHVPTAILMISLWILSHSHEALRVFLNESLVNQFSNSYIGIIVLASFQMALSCSSACVNMR